MSLAAVAFGLWMFPLAITGTDLARLPGDQLDSRFNNYILQHGHSYLVGKDRGFWTAPFFYPVPRTTALSDSHIGTLPIFAFFRRMGADRETAYQLWWLACYVINYVAGYLALRGFGARPLGAVAGAYLFAFGLSLHPMIAHSQLTPRAGIPLAFYWCWRFLLTGRTRYWAGTGLAIVWQLYATIYVGYFLGIALVGFLAVGLIAYHREIWTGRGGWQTFLARAAVLVGCGLLLWPLASAHRAVADPHFIEANLKEVASSLPGWKDWFTASDRSLVWGWTLRTIGFRVAPLMAGGLVFLGFFAAFIPARRVELRRIGLMAAGAWIGCILLTVNIGDHSPYWLLTKLPGAGAIRAVYRVTVVAVFPAGLLVGLLVTRIELASVRFPRLGLGAAFLAALLAVGDQYASYAGSLSFEKAPDQARVMRIMKRIRSVDPQAKSAVVLFTPKDPFRFCVRQLDVMLATQMLGIATLNGYSGHTPNGWPLIDRTGVVQRWKIQAAERYGHEPRSLMRYYFRHHFDHLVVIDPFGEGSLLGPYTHCQEPIPPEDCRADLAVTRVSDPWMAKRISAVKIALTNPTKRYWPAAGIPAPGEEPWNAFGKNQLFVSHRWMTRDGREVIGWDSHPRGLLPQDVPPGGTVFVTLNVLAPDSGGDYVLEVSAAQEYVGWFHHRGGNPILQIPVQVAPPMAKNIHVYPRLNKKSLTVRGFGRLPVSGHGARKPPTGRSGRFDTPCCGGNRAAGRQASGAAGSSNAS